MYVHIYVCVCAHICVDRKAMPLVISILGKMKEKTLTFPRFICMRN